MNQRLESIQRAITCISQQIIRVQPNSGHPGTWELVTSEPKRLPGRRVRFAVSLREFVSTQQGPRGWEALLTGYEYAVLTGDSLSDLLLYHLHSTGRSHVSTPHLHLGSPLSSVLGVERSIHLPTGQVRLEEFIAMLIRETGVRPLRRHWARVLAAGSER